ASIRKKHVLGFVDEVLRGTNTTERIAASSAILRNLSDKGVLVFAATHDLELTSILDDIYENYHFEEEMKDDDVTFPYKLSCGKTTSRNAIKLLDILGYDKNIVIKANEIVKEMEERR
ncbi:MAG: DNA mismatch repair protein MutS, partial [Lachnospiraceae bacterium]|nr:DNA mismatch repair protein MutS [Lachnospiraceae bacterium]